MYQRIECPAEVTLQFGLHKGHALKGPMVESVARGDEGECWMVVESHADAMEAARGATSRMVDLLVSRWGVGTVEAYVLCSVAMNLRMSQLVNEPVMTVSAAILKSVLPARRLF